MLPDARPARVVLADDECLFRMSLRQLLTIPPSVIQDVYGTDVGAGFDVVGEASSGEETVRVVAAVRPDLLLIDLNMPRLSGLEAVREILRGPATPRTILLTGEISHDHVIAAVRLGVHGVFVKAAATSLLFQAMAAVAAGRCWLDQTLVSDLIEFTRPLLDSQAKASAVELRLTPREREVLRLVAAGCGNKDIARTCALSEDTVKHHLTRLFVKTGAANRIELARCASSQPID
jgi:DNA-binding NarL/FixJ family response regulator